MRIEIDGSKVGKERDFHLCITACLGLHRRYGQNLDALWDLLSASVERPFLLVWKDHGASMIQMGKDFDAIINVLARVVEQDKNFGWEKRFSFSLE